MAIWALVFLVATFPFCIYATWTDLKFLKIPNIVSVALVLMFIIIGPFVLPLEEYGLRLLYGLITLLISLVLFSLRVAPGGDLKFISAIVPFVATSELITFVIFVSVAALAAVFTHSAFRWLGLAPKEWASWQQTGRRRRFPLAYAISGGLLAYLASHAIQLA